MCLVRVSSGVRAIYFLNVIAMYLNVNKPHMGDSSYMREQSNYREKVPYCHLNKEPGLQKEKDHLVLGTDHFHVHYQRASAHVPAGAQRYKTKPCIALGLQKSGGTSSEANGVTLDLHTSNTWPVLKGLILLGRAHGEWRPPGD